MEKRETSLTLKTKNKFERSLVQQALSEQGHHYLAYAMTFRRKGENDEFVSAWEKNGEVLIRLSEEVR